MSEDQTFVVPKGLHAQIDLNTLNRWFSDEDGRNDDDELREKQAGQDSKGQRYLITFRFMNKLSSLSEEDWRSSHTKCFISEQTGNDAGGVISVGHTSPSVHLSAGNIAAPPSHDQPSLTKHPMCKQNQSSTKTFHSNTENGASFRGTRRLLIVHPMSYEALLIPQHRLSVRKTRSILL